MNSERLGFALRPGVFSAPEIRDASGILEGSRNVAGAFIPDGPRAGLEAIEIASAILATTGRLYVGSGVIRPLEHDPTLLARRVLTIQAFSSNRLILGVGTGARSPQPGEQVQAMLDRLDELKRLFNSFPRGIEPPEIYVATLKKRIARCAVNKADGLLLNFCSPGHVRGVVEAVKPQMASPVEFACYLKLFYSSKNDEAARRLLVQEFLNYDSLPQYHEMFVQDGTADAISSFRKSDGWRSRVPELPRELLSVSLANPTDTELRQYLVAFREAGITLPVPYPYFTSDEKPEFKQHTVRRIIKTV